MSQEEQTCFYLSGLVQGVGMRHFVKSQAERLGLKGFVRNLSDGRVQCVAQGDPELLREFRDILSHSPVGRVEQIQEEVPAEKTSYRNFTIKP